jgi:osmoprotectant transport system ATP-binding protein
VDADGRVAGVITAAEVLALIEADRRVRQGAR